jgi:hypothetical protein
MRNLATASAEIQKTDHTKTLLRMWGNSCIFSENEKMMQTTLEKFGGFLFCFFTEINILTM